MKKFLFVFLGICLALFSFVSCDNSTSHTAFEGDVNDVAEALDPVSFVKGVFAAAEKENSGVTIAYSLASGRAIEAGAYTLTATATFDGYETGSLTIESGSLIYKFEGNVDGSGRFAANTYSVSSRDIRVSGEVVGSSAVNMSITVDKTTTNNNVFQATIPATETVGTIELIDVDATIIITKTTEVEVVIDDTPANPVTGTDSDSAGSGENPGPEFTQEDIVIDYIESIKKDAVEEDLIAAVANPDSSPLDVKFTLDDFFWGAKEIKFSITIKDEAVYDSGFWNKETLQRKVTSGSVAVTVTGSFSKTPVTPDTGDGGDAIATFAATGYHIVGSGSVTDAIYGEHKLAVDISGDFNAVISLTDVTAENSPEGATFRLDSLEFSLPEAGDGVKITMDDSLTPVDYAEVLEVVGSTTGTETGN